MFFCHLYSESTEVTKINKHSNHSMWILKNKRLQYYTEQKHQLGQNYHCYRTRWDDAQISTLSMNRALKNNIISQKIPFFYLLSKTLIPYSVGIQCHNTKQIMTFTILILLVPQIYYTTQQNKLNWNFTHEFKW